MPGCRTRLCIRQLIKSILADVRFEIVYSPQILRMIKDVISRNSSYFGGTFELKGIRRQ